ncbi:translation elongation factor Ts [Aliivibrio fischeri]|uniref:Translation elongation factor Ts n=3 Tax=Aliivibrio fischeri TaxID=668 RepID=A0A510UEI9_ALIFS|nr:translation elongation factor Ts [Aliivibrio fischeri]
MGQMGTMKKQKQIQQILNALGWSHATFADIVFEELYADELGSSNNTDKDAIRKLAASIKKQLQRSSTADELLNKYLRILSEHPDYQALNLDMILMKYVDHSCLSTSLTMQLTNLSKELDSQN